MGSQEKQEKSKRKLSIIAETNEETETTEVNVTVEEESSQSKQDVKLMSKEDIEKADKLLNESKEMISKIKERQGIVEVEEKKVKQVEAKEEKSEKEEIKEVKAEEKEIQEEQIKPLRAEEISLKSRNERHMEESVSKVQVKKAGGLEDGDNEVMDGDMI